jgi:hypothetical protein
MIKPRQVVSGFVIGGPDVIDYGPGEDIAIIDRFDVAIGCEHAYSSRRELPKKAAEDLMLSAGSRPAGPRRW